MKPSLVAILAICLGVAMAPVSAQQPRDNARPGGVAQGVIEGRVVVASSGLPLRRALVVLAGGTTVQPIVLTDEEGRFAFRNLPAGRYSLVASKSGYATVSYGQTRPGETGRQVELNGSAAFTAAHISLPLAGVLVSRVSDDLAEPVVGVSVTLQQQRFVDGERRLVTVARGETDVRGEYRFAGLLPGNYHVLATPDGLAAEGGRVFGPTYHPSTEFAASAVAVPLAVGEEARADVVLVVNRPATLSGTLKTSQGAVGIGLSMRLVNRLEGPSSARNITPRPDGAFSIANVWPGDYALQVQPASATSATQEFASIPVRVSQQNLTLDVATAAGGVARGRVAVAAGSQPVKGPQSMGIVAVPTDATGLPGRQSRSDATSGTFEIKGLTGPVVFRLDSSSAQTWTLKSIVLDGTDVTDTPVDFQGDRRVERLVMEITPASNRVAGTAIDSAGRPAADYTAVVFAEDRAKRGPTSRYLAVGRPDQSGRFELSGLPAGRYLVAAIDYFAVGDEYDTELLQRLEKTATRLDLGEQRVNDLRLVVQPY